MAKKNDRGRVKLTEKDLSDGGRAALDNLSSRYTSLDEIQTALDALKTETNGNAEVEFHSDEYYGETDATIKWYRDETDEEWAARLEKNKNIAAGQRKKRATDRKKKEEKERAELVRLQKKYAGE